MLKCNYLLICIIFISYFWVFEISIFKNILIYTSMWCSSFRNLRLSFFLSSINWLRDKMIRLRVINVKDIFSMVICTIKFFKPAEKYTIVGNTVSIQGMHWNKQKKKSEKQILIDNNVLYAFLFYRNVLFIHFFLSENECQMHCALRYNVTRSIVN